ncbi:Cytochrome P450 2J3 [Paramyrothecium foliicola]|nr:Cytochrome P450 2J3 [Paramyrothecium foliicola]
MRTSLPHIPFLWPARAYTIDDPWKKYADARSDLIALTQLSTPDYAVYITSSPEASRLILSKSNVFLKPLDMFRYRAINIFGHQIVSTQNGLDHRRHRLAVQGCFGESTMRDGWDSMAGAFQEMIQQENITSGGILVDAREVMIKVTMRVICQSWFGVYFPWTFPATKDAMMPFYEALQIVESSMLSQLLLPLWFMKYNPMSSVRRLGKAQSCMLHHLKSMVARRRTELATDANGKQSMPRDVLGALVAAQAYGDATPHLVSESGLSEEEIIGNIFIFVVAGHETTSNTLAFTLAFLAIYPEWQERLYQEILKTCKQGLPSYQDINALPLVLATCYEAIRLRDIVMTLPKVASEDLAVPYKTWTLGGEVTERVRIIPKGSHVVIDPPASQRNPYYWDDAMEFRPTRHILGQVVNSENFIGFSRGERKCIGKRFAEVEMVCFLSHLVHSFTWVAIPLEGETKEQMVKRILSGRETLSLRPGSFNLNFTKRL